MQQCISKRGFPSSEKFTDGGGGETALQKGFLLDGDDASA